MINLAKFSKMSFTELTSLPNYYIHTIYKLFVNEAIAREQRMKEEEERARKQAEAQQRQAANQHIPGGDSQDVANLRRMLSGQGVDDDSLEELMEEIEDGGL